MTFTTPVSPSPSVRSSQANTLFVVAESTLRSSFLLAWYILAPLIHIVAEEEDEVEARGTLTAPLAWGGGWVGGEQPHAPFLRQGTVIQDFS